MFERFIHVLRTDDPGGEDPAGTRERLRARFAPGATRRMTQLGMLIGSVSSDLEPAEDVPLVYASAFGESRALEGFLESFPSPSPTLFQTSIHPSAVQQALIGRKRSVREVFPMAGGPDLGGQALLAAASNPAPRVILCGGEERGTWLREHGVASARTFAFAVDLRHEAGENVLGSIALEPISQVDGKLSLAQLFDLLHRRDAFDAPVLPGWRLILKWQ